MQNVRSGLEIQIVASRGHLLLCLACHGTDAPRELSGAHLGIRILVMVMVMEMRMSTSKVGGMHSEVLGDVESNLRAVVCGALAPSWCRLVRCFDRVADVFSIAISHDIDELA